jgi:hypothetical protein
MNVLRALLVSLFCLGSAVCMRLWGGRLPWERWMPAGLLVGAAVLAHHRHTASQLLVRAVLWSNLLLAGVAAWCGNAGERPVAAALGAMTGLALLALGRRGLDSDADAGAAAPFVPIAFRSTLVALFVMALADAQTLLLFGCLFLENRVRPAGLIALALAALLVASIIGIYRLRVWGLLLNAVACAGVIACTAAGVFHLPGVLNGALLVSAAVQLVFATPLFVALVTGAGAARKSPRLARPMLWLSSAAVVALIGAAVTPMAGRLF